MILLEIPPYGKTYDLTYPAARETLYTDLSVDGFFKTGWGKQFEGTLSQAVTTQKEVNDFLSAVLDFIKLKYGKANVVD
jgi:hypothetical protein